MIMGTDEIDLKTKSNWLGNSRPNKDGPRMRPPMISPTTRGCPSNRATLPERRAATRMATNWISVKETSLSVSWTEDVATARIGVMSGKHRGRSTVAQVFRDADATGLAAGLVDGRQHALFIHDDAFAFVNRIIGADVAGCEV